MSRNQTNHIFGIPVTILTLPDLLREVVDARDSDKQLLIFYVNAHCLNLAYTLPRFRDVLREADILFVDGFGVILAGYILGTPIPFHARMTPPDWIDELAATCISQGNSMYFLGAKPGVAEKAAEELISRNPGVSIAGTHHGFFNKSRANPENQEVIEDINKSNADIILVGFGMPLQESWITENKESLSAKVFLPVGALFDYLAGEVRRGPRILTDYGFEWLARLVIEPRRLWARYVIGNPLFLWRVIKQRLGLVKLE